MNNSTFISHLSFNKDKLWTRERFAKILIRGALATIYIWFGALKLTPSSPASDLVEQTARIWFPFASDGFIYGVGVWEVMIGLLLLHNKTLRWAILLLFLQMLGAMSPLVLLPEMCFEEFPFKLTLEGQYIMKNLVLMSGAFMISPGRDS